MEQTMLYQLHSYGGVQMMSYVLRTQKGSLIVIDGGNTIDGPRLLAFLQALSPDRKPEVAAWFLTHAHLDHIDAFMDIINHHGEEITVHKLYYRFPAADFFDRYEAWQAHTIHAFEALLPRVAAFAREVAGGDAFAVDDVLFEVLNTPDETFTVNAINNTSLVLRATVGGQRILFPGDLGLEAGDALLNKLGPEALRAEICQMAHHGQKGVSKEFYRAVSPRLCLWPTPLWLWNNDAGKGYDTHDFKTIEVQGWMRELHVPFHCVTKDGTYAVSLPFTGEESIELVEKA